MKRELGIDIETFSTTDIKLGVHRYTEDPEFRILLLAYQYDDGPVQLIDLEAFNDEESDPDDVEELNTILRDIEDPSILKTAYNAQFEITCLSKWFKVKTDPRHWSCTMAWAAQAGLPFGLDLVAKAIQGERKMEEGKDLVKFFTMPCKPTKTNKMRTRNQRTDDFDKWLSFREYCRQDVVAERAIRKHLQWFRISEFEKPLWALDQFVNYRGVRIDRALVENAIRIDEVISAEVKQEIQDLMGVEDPTDAKIKKYILETEGVSIPSLNKDVMEDLHKRFKGTEAGRILSLRDKVSHAAVKKYTAMVNSVNKDGRIRGLFQYYGANRTGRWTSRNVQLQNLKRNDLEDLDFARELVRNNKLQVLKMTYDDVGSVLSNLVRTAFIPAEGSHFVVSDFSAIEARVLAWFANEKWRLEVFRTHGKIYEASAAMMFKIPIEEVDSERRRRGKISELALGYQGSVGAMEKMGGSKMGLTQSQMEIIVQQWRSANRSITRHWWDVQKAAIMVLTEGVTASLNFLKFYKRGKNLCILLPSGRELVYLNCRYTGQEIVYDGMNQTTKQWSIQNTYGGKLVENIVQATSRDILADAMKRVEARGHKIVMHVHDEIVIETNQDIEDEITEILSTPIPWAPGLPLKAETFTCKYYQK